MQPRFTPPGMDWQPVAVSLCAKNKPSFEKKEIPGGPGLYLLEIDDRAYLGTSANLGQRLANYRNPTPDIYDEKYRSDLIRKAKTTRLFCHPMPNSTKQQRQALETQTIAALRAAGAHLINRGATRDRDYLQGKVEHLEALLEQARTQLAACE